MRQSLNKIQSLIQPSFPNLLSSTASQKPPFETPIKLGPISVVINGHSFNVQVGIVGDRTTYSNLNVVFPGIPSTAVFPVRNPSDSATLVIDRAAVWDQILQKELTDPKDIQSIFGQLPLAVVKQVDPKIEKNQLPITFKSISGGSWTMEKVMQECANHPSHGLNIAAFEFHGPAAPRCAAEKPEGLETFKSSDLKNLIRENREGFILGFNSTCETSQDEASFWDAYRRHVLAIDVNHIEGHAQDLDSLKTDSFSLTAPEYKQVVSDNLKQGATVTVYLTDAKTDTTKNHSQDPATWKTLNVDDVVTGQRIIEAF